MQPLLDLFPVIAFFIAYKLAGLYVATAVLIVGVLAQTAYSWFKHRKVSPMLLASAVIVMIFGGLTLVLRDKTFIQWKPTILNWLFAAVLIGSEWYRGPSLVERMMGKNFRLEAVDWTRLNRSWAVFFLFCGALNLYVARNFEESTWVNFKLFGLMGLMLAFMLLQVFWISRRGGLVDPDES